MGAIGAALATLIARIIGAVVLIAIAHGKVRYIYIEHLFTYRPNKEIIKAILHIGVPNGIENSLFQFGKVITSSLISTLSTASIAANAAALSLANLQYTTGGAVQSTMISVVGKCVGAEEKEQAKHYAKVLLFLGYVLIFIVSVLLAVFATPLLSLYNLSPEGLVTARELIWFHGAASIVLWATAFCLPSVFRAANDVRFTMVVSIFSMWAFRVALAQILVPESLTVFGYELAGAGMDIMGVWVAMTIDWVFRAILFAWRFCSGRWLTKYKALQKG
jgi:Na+-driven multidrug efflux pump